MLHASFPANSRLRTIAFAAAFAVLISGLPRAGGQEPPPTAPCDVRLQEIVKVYNSIPDKLASMTNEAADALATHVEGAKSSCRQFLNACKDSPHVPEVQFYYAKFLFILSKRARIDAARDPRVRDNPQNQLNILDELMLPYYTETVQRAESALEKLPKDSKHRSEIFEILGWGYSASKAYPKARDTYLQFVKEFPQHRDLASTVSALSRTYLDLGQPDSGIEVVEKALKDPTAYGSENYPLLHESLWKLLAAKGDLAGMKSCAANVLAVFPLRLEGKSLGADSRQLYERFVDVNGFRKGYASFALGELGSAKDEFRLAIQFIDAKEKREAALSRSLTPVAKIHRDRSRKCLEFLEQLAEKPSPVDFVDVHWVTAKRFDLGKAREKVVGLVFRGVDDERSREFTRLLGAYAAADPDTELVSISYLKSAPVVDEQIELLQREIAAIGYTETAGFDLDSQNRKLFRAFKANVGSATFIAFNRGGMPVWFQEDPRDVDAPFSIAILKRLKR